MMKSAPQSCGKDLLVRVSARRFFAKEDSPQTEEAFARDGHSPQGDIVKRLEAKGVRRKEVLVGCWLCLEPYALRLGPETWGTAIPARQNLTLKRLRRVNVKILGYVQI
jgi:hypothetical protein